MEGQRQYVPVWKGIVGGRCPACREGKLFKNGMLHVSFLANHPHCPVCGVSFEPEPGFFWGAMYFNYAFNVALLAGIGLFMHFGLAVEAVEWYLLWMIGSVLALIPLSSRLSRMLWFYVFGPYRYRGNHKQSGKG